MISATKYYKSFKNQIGHTNHQLLTILVGLDAVRVGTAIKPVDLPAEWNPRNVEESAKRSRRFARSASIAWAVDWPRGAKANQRQIHQLL